MPKSYSVTDTAKLLGYSRNSIYSFLKNGDIKSIRIGKGKIRIPESEIQKFMGGNKADSRSLIPEEVRQESKQMVESMVAESKESVQPNEPAPVVLSAPRPGKSLEELSGEPPLYTLKLWLEERVVLPRLFDWFIGLSSIVLGISMFLHSKQIDIVSVGRNAVWFTPIKISFILSGIGLIVADMIQEEFVKYRNLSNYFRALLFITYASFAWILLLGRDIDGFAIYGLFAIAVLLEAVSTVRSSTAYMVYIQSLLISTALIFQIYPADPATSQIADGLFYLLDGYKNVWILVVVSLVLVTLYGFFWSKKVLKKFSAICGMLLTILALYFANNNYWERAFFVLIAGMIGMIMPFWESFKKKFLIDRPIVFRMFGTILMFFSIVVVIIAIVQSILLQNANRVLAEKSEFGRVTVENVVQGGYSAIEGIAQNSLFQNSLAEENLEQMDSFTKAIFKNNESLGAIIILNESGRAISSYPFSSEIVGHNYVADMFFREVSSGNKYLSKSIESLFGVTRSAVVMASPIMEQGRVVGAIAANINLDSLADRLDEVVTAELGQRITLIDGDGRWLSAPAGGLVGERVSESDASSLLWSRGSGAEIGYDSEGQYSLLRSSKSRELNWSVVSSQPVFSILDVGQSGLMVVLFLLMVAVVTVSFTFIFSRNGRVSRYE